MNKKVSIFIVVTTLLFGHETTVHGASILDSKHNLSALGPNVIKATTESEVCIFCHTPHGGRLDIPYLWNRSNPTEQYEPYASTTMNAKPGQPTGASRLCLSCHDGTIALGKVLSKPTEIPFSGATFLSGRSTSLATDLSDDHPVSFSYQSSIDLGNTELVKVLALPSSVQLDSTGQLQCTACHDPHDNALGKFLVKTNLQSQLCTGCHDKTGWVGSSHATSTKTTVSNDPYPWPDGPYNTVKKNGCGNCHRPHSADRGPRLLKQVNEEDTCLACHSGQVADAAKSIQAQLDKQYIHPVDIVSPSDNNIIDEHDATENFETETIIKHVECEDCHNPHQVNSTTATAPSVPGRLQGVPGVDFYTNKYLSSSTKEYEICFKCHGENIINKNNVLTTPPPITRYWTNTRDNRVKFNPGNVSYHPVLAPLNKISDGMLNPPWVKGSMVYCTDCHGSDSSGVKGPHGSGVPHILVGEYVTSVELPTSPTAYLTDNALCFKCHNATTLIGPTTKFKQHNKHLTDQHMERCTYCHDPHGSPTNSGMINFDIRPGIVSESQGRAITLTYPLGAKTSCVLVCHGEDHKPAP